MRISSDGLIQLSIDELLSTPIVHMMSGVDVDGRDSVSSCGRPTTITGFTEWVTETEYPITIGWGWTLEGRNGVSHLRRVGLPHTNVLLADVSGQKIAWAKNLEYLATIVDALPWVDKLLDEVGTSKK